LQSPFLPFFFSFSSRKKHYFLKKLSTIHEMHLLKLISWEVVEGPNEKVAQYTFEFASKISVIWAKKIRKN